MKPLVTTVIPTYRRPRYLARALRSAAEQTYPHLEILVCDNASGDETEKVVRDFQQTDPRVRYHVRERNLGIFANMVKGLQEVRTPYFSFLSDDDVLLPNFHESLLPALELRPEAAFAAGRSLLMTDAGRPVSVMPSFRKRSGYYKPPQGIISLLSGHMVSHMAITGLLFRTEVARRHWPVFHEERYPFDVEIILTLTSQYPYLLQNDLVLLIRLHEENMAKSRIPLYRGWLNIFRDITSQKNLAETDRQIILRKFQGQLKNAFTKIWLRCIVQENWTEAYILTDLLREEFSLDRLAGVLFRATQQFRKNPNSKRWLRLGKALATRDQKYFDRYVQQFESYKDMILA